MKPPRTGRLNRLENCLLYTSDVYKRQAMAQALVQLNAPDQSRGSVIGVFSMSAMGLRTFSGLSVGLFGASVGIHRSLALSAAAFLVLCTTVFVFRSVRRQGAT